VREHRRINWDQIMKNGKQPLTRLANLATLSPRRGLSFRAVELPTRSRRNRFPSLNLRRSENRFQLSCQIVKAPFKALAILAGLAAQQ